MEALSEFEPKLLRMLSSSSSSTSSIVPIFIGQTSLLGLSIIMEESPFGSMESLFQLSLTLSANKWLEALSATNICFGRSKTPTSLAFCPWLSASLILYWLRDLARAIFQLHYLGYNHNAINASSIWLYPHCDINGKRRLLLKLHGLESITRSYPVSKHTVNDLVSLTMIALLLLRRGRMLKRTLSQPLLLRRFKRAIRRFRRGWKLNILRVTIQQTQWQQQNIPPSVLESISAAIQEAFSTFLEPDGININPRLGKNTVQDCKDVLDIIDELLTKTHRETNSCSTLSHPSFSFMETVDWNNIEEMIIQEQNGKTSFDVLVDEGVDNNIDSMYQSNHEHTAQHQDHDALRQIAIQQKFEQYLSSDISTSTIIDIFSTITIQDHAYNRKFRTDGMTPCSNPASSMIRTIGFGYMTPFVEPTNQGKPLENTNETRRQIMQITVSSDCKDDLLQEARLLMVLSFPMSPSAITTDPTVAIDCANYFPSVLGIVSTSVTRFSLLLDCPHYGSLAHVLSHVSPMKSILPNFIRMMWIRDIAQAVQHIHTITGAAHGTLQPEHILLTHGLKIKLIGMLCTDPKEDNLQSTDAMSLPPVLLQKGKFMEIIYI
jgi:hypothetical protein